MLITLKEMMDIAEERQIAVGSFNTPNLESLQAVLSAADELQLPVIIQHAQCHEDWIPLELIGPLMVELARKAKIPVCVHLDHGETLEYLQRALELGFTSVMYDGSGLGYQENVENTKKAVALAARWGASVEAELGSMGKRESGAGDGTGEADETKIYTDPRQAAEFVRETGIDALACSFGTTHGIYLTAPKLNFSIVEEVRREAGGIPVVMHGGSGVSPREFHRAVQAGVRKINYFTYMDKAGGTAAAQCAAACREGEPLFYSQIIRAAREGMKKNVKEAMGTFALLDQ